MTNPRDTVERVARALCYADTEDFACASKCMNNKRCMAEKLSPAIYRDARAAIAALDASGNDELVEALKDARAWIADDPEMGPREAQVHRKVLARIDAAIARTQEQSDG